MDRPRPIPGCADVLHVLGRGPRPSSVVAARLWGGRGAAGPERLRTLLPNFAMIFLDVWGDW